MTALVHPFFVWEHRRQIAEERSEGCKDKNEKKKMTMKIRSTAQKHASLLGPPTNKHTSAYLQLPVVLSKLSSEQQANMSLPWHVSTAFPLQFFPQCWISVTIQLAEQSAVWIDAVVGTSQIASQLTSDIFCESCKTRRWVSPSNWPAFRPPILLPPSVSCNKRERHGRRDGLFG